MIVINVLNITSIKSILKKAISSKLPPALKIPKIYAVVSNNIVDIITISVTINLLSLEKFLLKISPNIPIPPKHIVYIPMLLPKTISRYNPNKIPNFKPIFFFTYNPMNSTNIINKLGITPAIVNHVKKLDCKK